MLLATGTLALLLPVICALLLALSFPFATTALRQVVRHQPSLLHSLRAPQHRPAHPRSTRSLVPGPHCPDYPHLLHRSRAPPYWARLAMA